MRIGALEKLTLIDYPGKMACVVYTIGCNFRCPYCHNPELVDETVEREIPPSEILEFLARRQGFLEGVVITGGEPTMHRDLPNFIRQIKELGFLVKLDTNGTDPVMLQRLIEQKLVDYVAMDIKSPLGRYSETVARPVDTDAIRASIGLLLKGEVAYEFRTTVIKSMLSPEDIVAIGQEIKGARRYYLQKFLPNKILNPQFKRKTTYTNEEFEAFRESLQPYVDYCGLR